MSYTNPVYSQSCPDPFILKYCGEYYCYCTGWATDGKVIPILHSRDLIHWSSIGGAMQALPGGAPEYWAPEVSYINGRFFLYYSVGDGIQMRLRVAVASGPGGPFKDSGRPLSPEDFAIDAHVFEDEDGSRYLFYAKDFLEHTHIGTGIVVDRMIDECTLAGTPRPVALPRFDWQVFDRNRAEKGGVRWHTVEGPFVLKHKGRYFLMFSGGNWKNLTYGVSCAVADSMSSHQEWTQLEHNEQVPLVLSTIPGQVIGPGHNSVVRGPDNRQLYCVYHRWAPDESARLLSIDRLEWIGERLSVLGPSTTPQENPNAPLYPIFHQISGLWHKHENELIQNSTESYARSETGLLCGCFMVEVSMAALQKNPAGNSGYGLTVRSGSKLLFRAGLNPKLAAVVICSNDLERKSIPLPPEFSFSYYHLFRFELNGSRAEIQLDGRRLWRGIVTGAPDKLDLFSDGIACSFKRCAVTYGFEDTFFQHGITPNELNWRALPGTAGEWKIQDGKMCQIDADALNSVVVKEHPFTKYELVMNARLLSGEDPGSCYGFHPALSKSGTGPLLRIEERGNRCYLAWYSQENGAWQLPSGFDRRRAHQFRFRKIDGQLHVFREAENLGTLTIPEGPAQAALYSNKARVGFDLVRLTSLETEQSREAAGSAGVPPARSCRN